MITLSGKFQRVKIKFDILSEDTIIRDNIGYNTFGHGFFLEDGVGMVHFVKVIKSL